MGTRPLRGPRIGIGIRWRPHPRIGMGTRPLRAPRIGIGTRWRRHPRIRTGAARLQPGIGQRIGP
jgi:hypothetical protein